MIKAILNMGSNVTPINYNVTKRNHRMRVKRKKSENLRNYARRIRS